MTPVEIEGWLRTSHEHTIALFKLGAGWWPMTANHAQAHASAWATAFFVDAAKERCAGAKLDAARNRGSNDLNKTVIDTHWASNWRTWTEHEVLVDFAVHNWDAANPIQLTGESEMHAQHGVGADMDGANDYSWDFYKLLVMPSITRLFVGRVGGQGGASAAKRCSRLAESLASLVDWYGPALLRPHDELGVVLLPASKGENDKTIIMWSDRGRLRQQLISGPLV